VELHGAVLICVDLRGSGAGHGEFEFYWGQSERGRETAEHARNSSRRRGICFKFRTFSRQDSSNSALFRVKFRTFSLQIPVEQLADRLLAFFFEKS